MGSSGAGKTTLQDVLAGRKDTGEIKGEVLFQGRPLPISFTRTTGYCEQQDVHLPQATVREALEFSARLRQPRTTPDKDRIAYVDEISASPPSPPCLRAACLPHDGQADPPTTRSRAARAARHRGRHDRRPGRRPRHRAAQAGAYRRGSRLLTAHDGC